MQIKWNCFKLNDTRMVWCSGRAS